MPGDKDRDDFWSNLAAEDDDNDDDTTSAPPAGGSPARDTSPVIRRREAPVTTVATEPTKTTTKRRPGRWHWGFRIGLAALVGYGLGLITPTPEGAEISRDDADDEVRIEIEGAGGQRFVIDNATDLSPDELNEVINDLVAASQSAEADAGG